MIHKLESHSSFFAISNYSNIDNNQHYKHNIESGSVKYEGDTLYIHNGMDYIPLFENSSIDLSPQWKLVLEWARDKMYEEWETKKMIEKYPEAKQSFEMHSQILKTLKAMEALVNGEKNLD
jgi:hypothetical protein